MFINDARPLWVSPSEVFASATYVSLPRTLKVVGRNLNHDATVATATKVKLEKGGQSTSLDAVTFGTALDRYVAKIDPLPTLSVGTYSVYVSRDGGNNWVEVDGQTLEVVPDPAFVDPQLADCENPLDHGCTASDADHTECIIAAITDAGNSAGKCVHFGAASLWHLKDPNLLVANGSPTTARLRLGIVVPVGVSLIGTGIASTEIVTDQDWSFVPECNPLTEPNCLRARSAFTLLGDNLVTGIHFRDDVDYSSSSHDLNLIEDNGYTSIKFQNKFLRLGSRPGVTCPIQNCPTTVEDVTIAKNKFSDMIVGVGSTGRPVHRLQIRDNDFHAFRRDIVIDDSDNPNDPLPPYPYVDFVDSAIASNRFYPSVYVDPVSGSETVGQGVIATNVVAGDRLDFSSNMLYGEYQWPPPPPSPPPPNATGWRGAHFFFPHNSLTILVSDNEGYCTGEKANDGEYLAFDHGSSIRAESAWEGLYVPVDVATTNSITVTATWKKEAALAQVPEDVDTYYKQRFFVRIVNGKGLGQSRRILGIEDLNGGRWRVTVDPPWDVVPSFRDPVSFATASRQSWQTYIVDNTVDINGCPKKNPDTDLSGGIWVRQSMTDSAIEGNLQIEASDLELALKDSEDGNAPFFQYFNEIRANEKRREYTFTDCWTGNGAPCCKICCPPPCPSCPVPPCADQCCLDTDDTYLDCQVDPCDEQSCFCQNGSYSGISLRYSGRYRCDFLGCEPVDCEPNACTGVGQPPVVPIVGYGLSISHNQIVRADSQDGGAIALDRGSSLGLTSGDRYIDTVAIFNNEISDVKRLDALCACMPSSSIPHSIDFDGGAGIHVLEEFAHHTVLFRNTIEETCYPIVDNGTGTLSYVEGTVNNCQTVGGQHEWECDDSTCAAGGPCTETDTMQTQCRWTDGRCVLGGSLGSVECMLTCPEGETIHERECDCPAGSAQTEDRHLICK